MNIQHTTNGWARALTTALTVSVGNTAILNAGRRLLTTGTAGPLNVNQGFATSKFQLPEGRVARPRLLVAELSDQQWDRIEDAITARPDAAQIAGTAAISDRLTDPIYTASIPLVPAPQDISHTCNCTPEATSAPCAHSAAVGYLLADRIRTAPAPLFTLRGRPHQHLKKRLRAHPKAVVAPRTTTPVPAPAAPAAPSKHDPPTATIPAQSAQPAAPMPEPNDLDLTTTRPALTGSLTTPPSPLPDLEALKTLAADAAYRAGTLLGGEEPPLCPDAGSDLARFVTLPHGASFRHSAMCHLDLDIITMGHLTLAYTYGGPGGANTYLEPFTVDHDLLARAQAAIQPHRPAAMETVEYEDNRITDAAAGIQLRYGIDGRWYPYRSRYSVWQPAPGVSTDPAKAYRAAHTHLRSR